MAVLGATLAWLALAGPGGAASEATGLQPAVTFDAYSPLSGNAEITRRLVTPLTGAAIHKLAAGGKPLRDQPIDLPDERFVLYVPPHAPLGGYAVMVFVPPWEEARLPGGWAPVLDRFGVIFVSAARSGNDQSVLGRREPLAVLAAHNVMARYPVDPRRVYVAGFSGGSRVAMHLALGYPDLFRGAFLNAGSDPIGDAEAPIPPRELFARFQENTRLVYVTGAQDPASLAADMRSIQAMRRACVFDIDSETTAGAGHALASPTTLAHALQELAAPTPPDPAKLAACRAGLEREMTAEFAAIDALAAAGARDEARKRLRKLDARYGGLAAPRSVEVSETLGV